VARETAMEMQRNDGAMQIGGGRLMRARVSSSKVGARLAVARSGCKIFS
jgi:hypothetical protein